MKTWNARPFSPSNTTIMKHHRDNRPEICGDVQWLLLGVVAIATPSRAMGSFTGVILFGDSYSDVGNVYEKTSHALPPSPPYHSGRWSNGPIWCEQLALDLNLPGPTPSLLGGGDYAYAGARTGSGSTVYAPFAALNLGAQANSYLSSNTPAPDELFSVWGGANDFILGQTNSSVPVNNIAAHVTALANAGARQFVVPNMVPLGQLPRYRGTPDEPVLDSLSLQFNVELSSTLTSLESSLNVRIWRLDAAGLLQDMLTNPSTYGLTNVTNTALVGGTPVPNPDEYLFGDDQHATRVFHRILGGLAA